MMNFCIIDDERPLRSSLKAMLLHYKPKAFIQEASGVAEGVSLLKNFKPDILFLDIEMADGTGFDLLNAIQIDYPVIFVTANDHYAVKAFKYNAVDYIMKPVAPEEIEIAIKKVDLSKRSFESLLKTVKENDYSRIVLSDSQDVHLIEIRNIVYCQAIGNYTHFYLADGREIVISKTLKYYDDLLAENNFVRIHQSYLINLFHLERFSKKDGGEAILKSGQSLPVASRKREFLLDKFKSFKS